VTKTFFGRAGESEGESMSEHDEGEDRFVSIGERLKLAREARAMTLDDVANQTRIPIRHLQHIENEDWDALPAPTYAIGFTRNYANVIGLDGAALANELRDQIGGPRRRAAPAPEYYEPADPARVPPRSIAIISIVLILLLAGGYLLWRNTLGADAGAPEPVAEAPAENNVAAADNGQAAAPQDVTGQAVTLTALGDVWIRVTDGQGRAPLFAAMLNTGQTYTVPATATRPLLRTANPQLLRASAAGRDLGLIGPTRRTVNDVSLLAADLAARAAETPPAATPETSTPTGPRNAPPAVVRPAPTPAPATAQPPAPQPDAPLSAPLPQ
jgi:cytoskeletal protein RodZ